MKIASGLISQAAPCDAQEIRTPQKRLPASPGTGVVIVLGVMAIAVPVLFILFLLGTIFLGPL
jgi:hypothetical protein